MATRRKVVFDHDSYADFSWLDQWNTPATYKGNEVIACPDHPYATVVKDERNAPTMQAMVCSQCSKRAEPMPFDYYRQTVGNPENHVALEMRVYELTDDAEDWEVVDSLGNIDMFATSDEWKTGTFYKLSQLDGCPYLQELAKDAGLE